MIPYQQKQFRDKEAKEIEEQEQRYVLSIIIFCILTIKLALVVTN